MSRQQRIVRVWTHARVTARLRRADRRGAACGRAGHAGIARGAAGRGPALRHSCVFWTATQLFSFALPSYRTRGSLYKQTTGPAARTACTLTPHVYTTSNMLHTDHSTVVQADHVTDRTVVCRMSRIIGITCESCQTKHARLVALTCRPTTQNTLPTLHARHAAPVQ